jgi:hypothetical protein
MCVSKGVEESGGYAKGKEECVVSMCEWRRKGE